MDVQFYLDQIVGVFKAEMKINLTGVYLHGSLAMGCFNPNKSDVDILVIAKDKLSMENIKCIAKKLLLCREDWPYERGIEVSIVLERYLKQFEYPTPFEFHYSDYHREKYQTDDGYICGGFEDPDLAAHIVVTYHRGVVLYGKAIGELFLPIDRHFYIESIFSDIKGAVESIADYPVYYTLNLCRVLLYLKEGVVCSKKEGGEWANKSLPVEYQTVVQICLNEYEGVSQNEEWNNRQLLRFAEYMLSEIRQSM